MKAVSGGAIFGGQASKKGGSGRIESETDADPAAAVDGLIGARQILSRHAAFLRFVDDQQFANLLAPAFDFPLHRFRSGVGINRLLCADSVLFFPADFAPRRHDLAFTSQDGVGARLCLANDFAVFPHIRQNGEFERTQAGHLLLFLFDHFAVGAWDNDFDAVAADLANGNLLLGRRVKSPRDGTDQPLHDLRRDFLFFLRCLFRVDLEDEVGTAGQVDSEAECVLQTSSLHESPGERGHGQEEREEDEPDPHRDVFHPEGPSQQSPNHERKHDHGGDQQEQHPSRRLGCLRGVGRRLSRDYGLGQREPIQ